MTEGTLFKKKPKEKDFFNSLMVNPMKQMVKLVEKNAINLIDLGDQLDWDMRFFRIRNGFIWLYQNDRSRESVGKFDLTKIEDIVAHPTKSSIFAIVIYFMDNRLWKVVKNINSELSQKKSEIYGSNRLGRKFRIF